IASALPVRMLGDADRWQREVLVVALDPVAIVVARAGKPDHLPAGHALVAAIDRVGEKPLLCVGQQLLEEAAGLAAEIDLAGFKVGDDTVLLLVGQFGERFAAIGGLTMLAERGERFSI